MATQPGSLAWRLTKKILRILGLLLGVLGILAVVAWWLMVRMPGTSHQGPLPPLSAGEVALRDSLKHDVEELAGRIGARHLGEPEKLAAAVGFIEQGLADSGLPVRRLEFKVDDDTAVNLEVEWTGTEREREVVVVGAHYDTVAGTPGADDNASGVAGLLELARSFRGKAFPRTLRLVAFANEEPPYFQRATMGSLVYALACRARGEQVVAMLALEMLGCFSDAEGSQNYPPPLGWLYPSRGDFITFVGNQGSRALVHKVVDSFRRQAEFPSQGAALPGFVPGVGWSDHWSFWQIDAPALMVTDTAFFRNPRYHEADDTPESLDYERMARVVAGLQRVVEELTSGGGAKDP